MAIKIYRPTTPGRRGTSVVVNDILSPNNPPKALRFTIKTKAGRNNQGKITVRHRGGGVKRFCRIVDFIMDKYDIPGIVQTIEYDPNRNAFIALVCYADGEKRYVIAHKDMKQGDKIISSLNRVDVIPGNRMPLSQLPTGIEIHNVELTPHAGGKIARSAGNAIMFLAIDGQKAILRLPSGEVRMVNKECMATVGSVSNSEYRNIRWGKAGRIRLCGIRPTVRGKVMNPVDHRHGGGEARNSIGLKRPVTYTGKPALGVKTRKKHKRSNRDIVSRRTK